MAGNNVKNKYSMDLKEKIFDQVAAARTGQKTVNDATNSILDLLSVVGRSEQLKDFAEFLFEKEYLVRRSVNEALKEFESL